MLLTFNAPLQTGGKAGRMSHTQHGQFTPSFARKGMHSKKKAKMEGDFLVVGQEVKGQPARKWGKDNNHSFKW